jgi:capsular exopolysaccharide synthesis family protein
VAFPEHQPPAKTYDVETPERESGSFIALLRRRAIIIVVTALLVGAGAAAFAYAERNNYEAKAQLLFLTGIGPELDALGLLPPAPVSDQVIGDAPAIAASRRVAELAARKLGGGVTADDVQNNVTVNGVKTSNVVDILATAKSRARAARLATVYAQSAVDVAEAEQKARSRRILDSLTAQYAAIKGLQQRLYGYLGRQLATRIPQLRAIADGGTGNPRIIQAGYAPSHKSGDIVQTGLLGLVFGLVLGVAFALLREQADRRLHRAEDVGVAFEAPVLATIPRNRALRRHAPFSELPPEVGEAFRLLQTNLRYGQGEPVRSLLVTSSRRQEGKTTIAWNLASVAATAGLSVALIEGDLRRATLAERHDLNPFPGLADVLEGSVSVTDAIQRVSLLPDADRDNGRGPILEVLVAGSRPPDPSALMQATYVGDLLDWFRKQYDLVVVDTPPIAQVADAISLLRHVDGVLVTASVNSTRGPEARRLREQLQALDARIFGVVANGGSAATGYAYAPSSQLRPA